jgi:hypothetical protein
MIRYALVNSKASNKLPLEEALTETTHHKTVDLHQTPIISKREEQLQPQHYQHPERWADIARRFGFHGTVGCSSVRR